MSDVVASLVVSFGEGADSDALVVLELDDVLNVDDQGEAVTQFGPGDEVFLRLHHDPSVRLGRLAVTHGQLVAQGSDSRDFEQQLLWIAQEDEHELQYLPADTLVFEHSFGNAVVGVRRRGQRKVVLSDRVSRPGQPLSVFPALSLVKYCADFFLFRLLAPDVELAEEESYPLTIVAYMEAVL